MFSKKATKIEEIFTVDSTVICSKCQIDGEDFVKFCGLLRKHELYYILFSMTKNARRRKEQIKCFCDYINLYILDPLIKYFSLQLLLCQSHKK